MSEQTVQQTSPATRRRFTRRGFRRSRIATAAGGTAVDPITEGARRSTILDRDRIFRRSLVYADAVSALVAFFAAVNLMGSDHLRATGLLAVPIVVVVSKLMGLYDRDELLLRKSTLDEAPALFQLATLYALLAWLLENVLISGSMRNVQVLGLWGLLFATMLVSRTCAREMARRVAPEERCLVVGDLEAKHTIRRKLEDSPNVKATLVGHLPLDSVGDDAHCLTQLEAAIREHDVHRVIVAPRGASDAMLDVIRLVKGLGVSVSLLPRVFEVVGSSVVFDDLNGVNVLGVRRFGLSRSSALVKRSVDILGAALGLLAVAPFLVAAAVAIRLDSKGSLFFRQVRVGRDGKCFEMLKFRTMIEGADAMKGRLRAANEAEGLFKIADDPRITRAGRFLRKTSLDELPQLLNVLRGDMSLVGPRPLVMDEDCKVEGWDRRRLHLTPGMTGHWQILGSSKIPLHEMVKIDYLYIANWSLWTDVKILLRTVPHMVRGGGM